MNTAHQHSAALSGAVMKLRGAVQWRLPPSAATLIHTEVKTTHVRQVPILYLHMKHIHIQPAADYSYIKETPNFVHEGNLRRGAMI